MESADEHLPVGARMTLSEAETRIGELNRDYWDSDEPERPVRVAIDYMLDGEVDRYWLPLRTGPGCRSLLEQMAYHVETNLKHPEEATRLFADAPAGLRELLHEQFGPQLHDDLEKLAGRVLTFFQQHHTITKLEQQFQTQAAAMPQKEKEKFLEYAKAAVTDLRKAANTSKTIAPSQERAAPVSAAPVRSGDTSKGGLRTIVSHLIAAIYSIGRPHRKRGVYVARSEDDGGGDYHTHSPACSSNGHQRDGRAAGIDNSNRIVT